MFTQRPARWQRVVFVAFGACSLVVGIAGMASESTLFVILLICGVLIVGEGIRAKVEIDHERGVVRSTRAVRVSVVDVKDVVNVRVPPWGPIVLTLRDGAQRRGAGGIWPRQVITGIDADSRGYVAARLASQLGGVPVVSAWSHQRHPDPARKLLEGSGELPTIRWGWIGVRAVIVLSVLAGLVVLTLP